MVYKEAVECIGAYCTNSIIGIIKLQFFELHLNEVLRDRNICYIRNIHPIIPIQKHPIIHLMVEIAIYCLKEILVCEDL